MLEQNDLVKVLYDFEYKTKDGRWVWMKEGESLIILDKANNDWWKVKRDEEKLPFYAPATYLKVIINESKEGSDDVGNCENQDSGIVDSSTCENDTQQSASSSDYNIEDLALDDENLKEEEEMLNDSDDLIIDSFENPIYSNLNILKKTETDDKSTEESNDNPVYANYPLGALSNVEPPVPSLKQIPVKILLNHWAEYIDDKSRTYYFNSVTKQSSWKPPRKRLDRVQVSAANNSTESETEQVNIPPSDSPSILKRASMFYDQLPQDNTFSSGNRQKTVKNKLSAPERSRNKSDSSLRTESSAESLTSDKKMHVWKSSPSIIRKFKMSIRGSPLMSRKKISPANNNNNNNNNNNEKECPTLCLNAENGDKNSTVISNPMCSSSEKIVLRKPSIPEGWSFETSSSGTVFYIHTLTGEKWQSSLDDSGRNYYYKVNGTESFWELPVIDPKKNQSNEHETDLQPRDSPKVYERCRVAGSVSPERDFKARSLIFSSVSESEIKSPSSDADSRSDAKSVTLPRSLDSQSLKYPWSDLKGVIREGPLHKTKVMDCGRRKRKDWIHSYTILTSSRLIFYKDLKSYSSKHSSMNKPELNVDLCGAVIDWCPEKSSRKNVFQVNTILGALILMQDDNLDVVNGWFKDIKKVIELLPSPMPIGSVEKSTSIESGMNHEDRNSRMLRSKSLKFMRHNDQVESVTNSAEKKKIKKKLKHFFLKRPTIESLTEKGIIKDEPVFGCEISQLCKREGSTVPRFVQECIGAIEQRDMKSDGLYRASGNISQIQKIRFQVNQDIFTGVHMEEDIHVLSGCLKMFFRHMKEPLIPVAVYNPLLAAIKIKDQKMRLEAIKENIYNLPRTNFDTLKFLLQHLLRVTEYSHENRMHVQNLAIVFGPTIMGADSESVDLAVDMMYQNQIFEFILLEFKTLYESSS